MKSNEVARRQYSDNYQCEFTHHCACWASNHNGWSKMKKLNRKLFKKKFRRETKREIYNYINNKGEDIMCEYCHCIIGHHPRCPNAPEPKVRGNCKQCGEELREDYEYYTDKEKNIFCSDDCAKEYNGIESKEWEDEEEWEW